jgi:hypothetical protein
MPVTFREALFSNVSVRTIPNLMLSLLLLVMQVAVGPTATGCCCKFTSSSSRCSWHTSQYRPRDTSRCSASSISSWQSRVGEVAGTAAPVWCIANQRPGSKLQGGTEMTNSCAAASLTQLPGTQVMSSEIVLVAVAFAAVVAGKMLKCACTSSVFQVLCPQVLHPLFGLALASAVFLGTVLDQGPQ